MTFEQCFELWVCTCFFLLLIYGPAWVFIALWEMYRRRRFRQYIQENLDRQLEKWDRREA